jgi:transposase
MEQPNLLEIPDQGEPAKALVTVSLPEEAPAPKFKLINRDQQVWTTVDVETMIAADHKARAIWELAGRLDLSPFAERVKTVRGEAGRAAWEPQLCVSLWVYAYSEGISSAREIERMMDYEPGFRWLSGMQVVNHHTLSDFRVEHKAALDEMFVGLLGMLEKEGLLSLEQVMHDGTKIQAKTSGDRFRREKTVREHLERARQVVESMGDPRQEGPESKRREAAQKRARREREAKLEEALKELEKIREQKSGEAEKQEARVSVTEPEARVMKDANQGYHPGYNLQISTDADNRIIVGMQLNPCASDSPALLEAMEQVEQNVGAKPRQAVVDEGYTRSRENIVGMADKGIELLGPIADKARQTAAAMKAVGIDPAFGPQAFQKDEESNTLRCPAGNLLEYVRQSHKRDSEYRQYQACGSDCVACRYQVQCCPNNPGQGRTVSILMEKPEVIAFQQRMAQPEAQQIYKRRGEVAEFPNAWIKDKLGVRKFRVFGLAKAATEAKWACLTYNVMQWIRLVWRKPVATLSVA